MGFYEQRAEILRPAKSSTRYNPDGEQLEYDTAKGAQLLGIPFGVDIQPRGETEIVDGNRVQVQTGWKLYTPPGCDLAVTAVDRIRYDGRDLSIVGDVHRWPSRDYPSGVDHVSLTLEFKTG